MSSKWPILYLLCVGFFFGMNEALSGIDSFTFLPLSCPLMSCNELPHACLNSDTNSLPGPAVVETLLPQTKQRYQCAWMCVWELRDFMRLLTDMFIPEDQCHQHCHDDNHYCSSCYIPNSNKKWHSENNNFILSSVAFNHCACSWSILINILRPVGVVITHISDHCDFTITTHGGVRLCGDTVLQW